MVKSALLAEASSGFVHEFVPKSIAVVLSLSPVIIALALSLGAKKSRLAGFIAVISLRWTVRFVGRFVFALGWLICPFNSRSLKRMVGRV